MLCKVLERNEVIIFDGMECSEKSIYEVRRQSEAEIINNSKEVYWGAIDILREVCLVGKGAVICIVGFEPPHPLVH